MGNLINHLKVWLPVSLLLFPTASAKPDQSGLTVVTPNQAVNHQTATGSVNQSPIGGVNNNTQINNALGTDYGFAPGIFCRGAVVSVGATSGTVSGGYSASNYGGLVSLSLPLPSHTDRLCRDLAKEIVLQRQLDTALTLLKQCALLKKEQIKFDLEVFPEFVRCKGVEIGGNTEAMSLMDLGKTNRDKVYVTVPTR